MKIIVFGAGAWGTALALHAANIGRHAHAVSLWTRSSDLAESLKATRENRRYLPGFALPEGLHIGHCGDDAMAQLASQHELAIVATPMSALRSMLMALDGVSTPVVWLCKGFEAGRAGEVGLLGHEVQRTVAPGLSAGVLSGPSFAQEVAAARPTALVAASLDPHVRQLLVQALHSATLRIYGNDDLIGVEVGGAVKNVLAIATGLCDGLQLGANARAALVTRGLAEMTRLGVALGARAETFMGLSGLGDLVLTATGDLSRNRQVGLALAQGKSLANAVSALGHVAEGVYSASTVVQRAAQLGLDMPIARAMVELLAGRLQPEQAVRELMGREPVPEGR